MRRCVVLFALALASVSAATVRQSLVHPMADVPEPVELNTIVDLSSAARSPSSSPPASGCGCACGCGGSCEGSSCECSRCSCPDDQQHCSCCGGSCSGGSCRCAHCSCPDGQEPCPCCGSCGCASRSAAAEEPRLSLDWDEQLVFPTAKEFMRARKEKPFTINVEGIVGSGKSTFIDVFKAYPCVDVLPEPVSAWSNLNGTDLLQLMYENPRRWGMTHESYVQYTMLEEHLRKVGVIKTMERSIHSSRYIFTEDLKQSGLMEPAEFAILDEWYQMLKQEFDLSADVTVYLQASPEGALDRIRKRGRPEEAQITVDYLRRLQRLHEDWFVHRNSSAPLPSQRLILMDTNRPLETMEHVYRNFAKKLWRLVPKELIYTCQATTNRIFG